VNSTFMQGSGAGFHIGPIADNAAGVVHRGAAMHHVDSKNSPLAHVAGLPFLKYESFAIKVSIIIWPSSDARNQGGGRIVKSGRYSRRTKPRQPMAVVARTAVSTRDRNRRAIGGVHPQLAISRLTSMPSKARPRRPWTSAAAWRSRSKGTSTCRDSNGMPPEIPAKAFEPLFTAKEVGKGTGLGLCMVYGFNKQSQSNGHIKIYSELGRGTSIKLYLRNSDRQREDAVIQQRSPMPRGNEHILVVEDDPRVRANVVDQLQSLGYAVSEASDGVTGLAAFEAASQPYALVLTDIVMPGPMNGRLFADELMRRWPKTKFVFMSGYTEDAIIRHGRLDPGVLLLTKPFHKSDLAQILRQALDDTGDPER
jgi:CheY-like chemotaxis protein